MIHKHVDTRSRRRRHVIEAVIIAVVAQPLPLHGAEPDHVPPIDARIQALSAATPLLMRFSGGSAEACRRWQEQFRGKLRSLLGPHAPPKHWTTTVERSVDLDDHHRDELVLSADGHPPLPVYLLIPKREADGPRPGVLAVHGHGPYGYDPVVGREASSVVAGTNDSKDADERDVSAREADRDARARYTEHVAALNYDYGLQLVRRGYVVVAPCLTPFGRRLGDRDAYRGKDPCAVTHVRLQLLGKLLIAENLRDCLWAFEFLARREGVNPERLGCLGLSYGGRMTMLTSALEPRIRAVVISGALNLMQERVTIRYSCGAQVIPGLLQFGDVPEIGSLIAPRPCVWEVGSTDGLLDPDRVKAGHARLRRAYAAFGAEDNLRVDHFEGGHRWNGRLAYPMLDAQLGSSR